MSKRKKVARGRRGYKRSRNAKSLNSGISRLTPRAPSKASETAKIEPVLGPALSIAAESRGPLFKGVLDNYGRVEILSREDEVLPHYKLKMPELTREEQRLLDRIKEVAVEEIKINPDTIPDITERRRIFTHEVLNIIEREGKGVRLPAERKKQLSELAVRDMLGYGPLDDMIADDNLDILVTAVGKPVYVHHRKYGMCFTNVIFENEASIRYIIDKMARLVGRRIDQQTPLLDTRLPDGSRVNATLPPVSLDGPTISIRKFRKDPLTIIDLLKIGTLSTNVAAFLWLIVDGLGIKPANILFAGGTGCGKTTMLNAATTFVPERERLVSIEDTAELQLPHKHWIRLETRPPNVEGRGEIIMDDLVKNALRMRPDRLIVGEVRGAEAQTMFTAMNTGHDGCMGTLHSNSAAETVTRLTEAPMCVPKIMIPALDVIVMLQRMVHRQKGHIRRITEICEVTGLEDGRPKLSRIFEWNPSTDAIKPTGALSKTKKMIADFAGVNGNDIAKEMDRRVALIELIKYLGVRNIFEVGKIIQEYYRNPEGTMKRLGAQKSVKRP